MMSSSGPELETSVVEESVDDFVDRNIKGAEIVNHSGEDISDISQEEIYKAIYDSPEVAAITQWATDVQSNAGSSRRLGGIFNRDRYLTPGSIYSQFQVAADAVSSDDVVSGALETTESLAFTKMKFDLEDQEQEDIWNQIAKTIDLDSRMREMWREMFTYSQVIVAIWWGTKNFKVRGKTDTGKKKKKTFTGLEVPLGMTMLDPMKVVPVGMFWFGKEKLLYMPDANEALGIDKVLAGEEEDLIIKQIILDKYEPNQSEKNQLADIGISTTGTGNFYLLNPESVWRHTDTKSGYQKFANVRLKSIFELLDIKNNLRQRDRTHLIAATNFIIVITKGTDERPATPAEVNALKGYARSLARMPLIVGDHRLKIEIVTPSTDTTLKPEQYNTIDARITGRIYRILVAGNYSAGGKTDSSGTLTRVIGKGLESSRHQLKRALERNLFELIMAKNDMLDEDPTLRFVPSKIALEFDPDYSAFMIELRQMNEISRETLLTEFDMDQDDEARWREFEKKSGLDDIFETINPNNQGVPGADGSAPGPADIKSAGRSGGGNSNGGGRSSGAGAGKSPRNITKKSD